MTLFHTPLRPFADTGDFAPQLPQSVPSLRRMAVRGASVTALSGGLRIAVQMIGTVTLARIIAPRDYGMVAVVTTFSFLLVGLATNGIPEAIIQCRVFTHRMASNLFWIYAALGLLLTAGFAATGRLFAHLYHEPQLALLAAGIAPSILFAFSSVLHIALLQKAMQFATVARNEIFSRAISVAVSILFACMGWKSWALVLGTCAYPLSIAVLAWTSCRWRPGTIARTASTWPLLCFALHSQGRYSINYCTTNTDNLLVGWSMGPRMLGYYKRAYDLFCLAATQLISLSTVVAVAALSRVRDNREEYARALAGALSVVSFIGMGIAGAFTLSGKDIILLLLGPGWEQAGRIFTYFAPGIGMMLLYGTHSWIHLSLGHADRWFRWGIAEWTITTLLFLAFLRWGPEGMAIAWGLSYWILVLPAMRYALRPIQISVLRVLSPVWRYVLAAIIATSIGMVLPLHLRWLTQENSNLTAALRISANTLLFTLFYLGAIVFLHGSVAPLRTLTALMRELRSSAPQAATSKEQEDPTHEDRHQ